MISCHNLAIVTSRLRNASSFFDGSQRTARQVEKEGRKEWERAVMRQTLRQINLAVVEQVRHR